MISSYFSIFFLTLKSIGNSDVLNIEDDCSIVKKEHGFTALIINTELFSKLLYKFTEPNVDLLELLLLDLKGDKKGRVKDEIYHYFAEGKKYLVLFFGRNEGKIRLPYEELEELELKYTASKYNV